MDTAPRMTRSRAKAIGDGSNTTPAAAGVGTRGSKTTATRARGNTANEGITPAPISKLNFGDKAKNDGCDIDTSNVPDQVLDAPEAPETLQFSPLPEDQPAQIPSEGPQPEADLETEGDAPGDKPVTMDMPAEGEQQEDGNGVVQDGGAAEPEVGVEPSDQTFSSPAVCLKGEVEAPKSALKPEFIAAMQSMEAAVEMAIGAAEVQEADGSSTPQPAPFQFATAAGGEADAQTPAANAAGPKLTLSSPMVHFAPACEPECGTGQQVESMSETAQGAGSTVEAGLPKLASASAVKTSAIKACTVSYEPAATPIAASMDSSISDDMAVKRVSICTPIPSHVGSTGKKAVVYTPYPKSDSKSCAEVEEEELEEGEWTGPADEMEDMEMETEEQAVQEAAPGHATTPAPAFDSKPDVYSAIREPKKDTIEDEEDREDVQGLQEDDGVEEAPYNQETDNMLSNAMGDLGIQPKREPLRGLPIPQGSHVRFDEQGDGKLSPTSGKMVLRGLPEPAGQHIRFD